MTGITDGVPFNPIDIITGFRILFRRASIITQEDPIPDTAIIWDTHPASWGGVGFEIIWNHVDVIPDKSAVWGILAVSWGGAGFEIIW